MCKVLAVHGQIVYEKHDGKTDQILQEGNHGLQKPAGGLHDSLQQSRLALLIRQEDIAVCPHMIRHFLHDRFRIAAEGCAEFTVQSGTGEHTLSAGDRLLNDFGGVSHVILHHPGQVCL